MQYRLVAGLVSAILAAVPICGQVHSNFQTPLTFEENRGQTASAVQFLAHGSGYTIFLTPEEAVFQFGQQDGVRPEPVRLSFPGSRLDSQLEGHDLRQRVSHYFVGRDESGWQRDVPHFGKVIYPQIYPGIDAVFYGAGDRRLEFDFIVAPGASPEVIRLGLEGVDLAEINDDGDLAIRIGNGEPIVVHRPHSYQEISGEPQAVASRFVAQGNSYGIQLDPYDHTHPLVIDPVLSYSTYLGGTGFDTALGIDVDAYGEAAVTGWTDFPDFPPSGAPPGSDLSPGASGRLVFVTKFQSDGTDIVFTSFIGGEADDRGLAIAQHHYGTIFVSGDTESVGFPTTPGAFQPSKGIGQGPEAFVFSLSRDGSEMRFSTYLGGDGGDEAWAIDVDNDQRVYVAGSTLSNDFPTTAGVVQPDCSPDATMTGCASGHDAFVTRLMPDGKSLGYSTYLGGRTNTDGIIANADDRAYGIAVNPTTGWATVTGWTGSLDFPTSNAAQNAHGGEGSDAFVTKLDFNGAVFVYSTYLGGSGAENFGGLGSDGGGVAVALDGTAYVTGKTGSTDFPAAGIPLPDTCVNNCGLNDAFVTRFSSAGAITYSSYLGGTSQDTGVGIDIDTLGRVYVTGETTSNSFPLENELYSFRNGTDGFVTAIDFTGPAPTYLYSTFFGGPGFSTADQPRGIVTDGGGAAYFAGDTASTNLPTTMGAYDNVYSGGGRDAFVTRILDAVKCVDGTEPVNDWDGDGIFTCWEEDGIDFDDDGTVDLPLHQPPFNANPDRKDIFVEIDHMVAGGHTHQPTAGALRDVIQAFANAPVLNPVGGPGITLHLMSDEAINPEVLALLFTTEGPNANDDFNDFKLGNPRNACGVGPTDGRFGTLLDRLSANCSNILGAKRLVFRYVLFAHGITGGRAVGIAELPGNDLILGLGIPSAAFLRTVGGLRSFEAATFMHEFGHTLGLGHGGGNHRNCKPNYLSIMNYSLTDRDLVPTRPLDFSRSQLPALDENNLSEPLGLQGAGGRSVVYGVAGATTIGQDVGPIDWNGNSSTVETGLMADISNVAVWCSPDSPPLSTLKGHDDWTNLTYSFRSSPDFADRSIRQTVLPDPERTPEQIEAAAMSVDFDGDGLSNFDDNCSAIPNMGQEDDDGDLLGDACDGCPFDMDLECLFSDGFESSDTSGWSAIQP